MRLSAVLVTGLIVLGPAAARAEFQISVYGGGNIANGSDVTVTSPVVAGTFAVEWIGGSSAVWREPYYGFRGAYWMSDFGMPHWGVAVDFTHAAIEADLGDPIVGASFSKLEFTDGINSFTLNALYRRPLTSRFTVYGGVGAGASIPHVELEYNPPTVETSEFQVTGPVVQGLVGASYWLGRGVSIFGEYKASYSWNEAELVGGGTLKSNILVHHFAAGLSYTFGGPPPVP